VIIRVFRARIHPGKEDEFERFVRDTGVPMVEAQAGCSQVTWGRTRWSDQPEFVVAAKLGRPLERFEEVHQRTECYESIRPLPILLA
jgi:hypothetical protein